MGELDNPASGIGRLSKSIIYKWETFEMELVLLLLPLLRTYLERSLGSSVDLNWSAP